MNGLFRNEDKPCPICGEPTVKLFAMKVDDQPICGKCKNQIWMDREKEKVLTLDQLREHLDYRRRNQEIRESMNISKRVSLEDALVREDKLCIDVGKRLWYIEKGDNPPVFSFDEIEEFIYREDNRIIYRVTRSGIEKNTSVVETVNIAMNIAFGNNQLNRNSNNNRTESSRPIREFGIEIKLSNRYITRLSYEYTGPQMTENNRPSYIRKYNQLRARYDEAANMMSTMLNCSGLNNQPTINGNQQTAATIDTVSEIKRYKEMMDAGIITEEEFNVKKRQLMGI